MSDFISIAFVVKARGVRGQVAAELLTDFPERFEALEEVRVETPDGVFNEALESHWFYRERIVLKFKGRDDPDAVAPLLRGYVQIPQSERIRLPEGSYYNSDLIGCRVFEGDGDLGTVQGVEQTSPDVANLVIVESSGREWMLPLVGEFIDRIDLSERRIQASPPGGLRELAVPHAGWKGKRKRRREKILESRNRGSRSSKEDTTL